MKTLPGVADVSVDVKNDVVVVLAEEGKLKADEAVKKLVGAGFPKASAKN